MRNKQLGRVFAATAIAGGLVVAGAGIASAQATTAGGSTTSPGTLSGNVIEIPVSVPVNACGLGVNLIGLADPLYGSTCTGA